jgi:hypothetical protein
MESQSRVPVFDAGHVNAFSTETVPVEQAGPFSGGLEAG